MSYYQFIVQASENNLSKPGKITEAFMAFDSDHNGFITFDEIKKCLSAEKEMDE